MVELYALIRNTWVRRVEEQEIVLAVQDTTELDYSEHSSKQGLGALSKKDAQGLKVHSVLCVSPLGVPLGVLHHSCMGKREKQTDDGAY